MLGKVNISEGIEPVKVFLERSIAVQLLQLSVDSTCKSPLKLLEDNEISLRCFSCERELGKVPPILFENSDIFTREDIPPIEDGIEPVSRLLLTTNA